MKIPLIRPAPPRLSLAVEELRSLERSGIYSNFGPINTRFEEEMLDHFFASQGACLTVCNATIGLMLAIKEAVGENGRGRFALMPSFTFAAAAHAAIWCGLTPLVCDIDTSTWAADAWAESEMLSHYGDRIAVVMPYSTFGFAIDLNHYRRITAELGVPVVVDAAASLGTLDAQGRGFGAGFEGSVVFSMHATKSFAVGEAGIIYSANTERIARLRTMSNFGFGEPRSATMAGLNGKLCEVSGLLGRLRLADYDRITAHRSALVERYRAALPEFEFQPPTAGKQAHQFVPVLLPPGLGGRRAAIRAQLAEQGIVTGTYFSPHLLEQPYFQRNSVGGAMKVCDDVAARIVSLPLYDAMTYREVDLVARLLKAAVGLVEPSKRWREALPAGQHEELAYGVLDRAGREASGD